MSAGWHIETLNDLFYLLFRSDPDHTPILLGHDRLMREDLFRLFFPRALYETYISKSLSNLTWFFNNDPKNKAIRRALLEMTRSDPDAIVAEVHQKCRDLLYPRGGSAAFHRDLLLEALQSVRLRSSLAARQRILLSSEGPARLQAFFDADPSAALARMLLTIALHSEAEDSLIAALWADPDASGCEFLSRDSSLSGRIRYGSLLYLEGRRAQAWQVFEEAAARLSGPARNQEESAMYCRMAAILSSGDGHYPDEKQALSCLEKACIDTNPEAWYLLARCPAAAPAAALRAMETAARMGHSSAIRELGNAWYTGQAAYVCGRDIAQARQLFHQGMSAQDENGAYCAYMLGRICEEQGDLPSARRAYGIAREKGSSQAHLRLSTLDGPMRADAEPHPDIAALPLRHCLTNAATGINRVFLSTLQGPWQAVVCESPLPPLPKSIQARCERQLPLPMALEDLTLSLFDGDSLPEKLVISLLSDDEADNLTQAADCLGVLARLARKTGKAAQMADRIRLLVRARKDSAALLLESAMAGLDDLYFPLRLCDPDEDAAAWLFTAAPLFLPCLTHPETGPVHAVILGEGDAALSLLRQAVSLPLTEDHPLTLSVFCPHPQEMERRFAQMCPGIYSAAPSIRKTIPAFFSCDLMEGGLARILRSGRNLRDAAHQEDAPSPEEILCRGSYFMVTTPDDGDTLRLAALLRRELLRSDPSFARLPFIAPLLRHPAAARLAGGLSSDPRGAYRACDQYDLFPFGDYASLYAWDALESDAIERRALSLHLSYAAPGSEAERAAALASYYGRFYHQDSSRALARYVSYRLFSAGLVLPAWQLYGMEGEEASLAPAWTQWLAQPGNEETAARQEHERWNCFMLSLGWEQATPQQVAAYVSRGNPGHQMHLARLHPFLCDWQTLTASPLVDQVARAVHALLPDAQVYSPAEADRDAVRRTFDLLAEN